MRRSCFLVGQHLLRQYSVLSKYSVITMLVLLCSTVSIYDYNKGRKWCFGWWMIPFSPCGSVEYFSLLSGRHPWLSPATFPSTTTAFHDPHHHPLMAAARLLSTPASHSEIKSPDLRTTADAPSLAACFCVSVSMTMQRKHRRTTKSTTQRSTPATGERARKHHRPGLGRKTAPRREKEPTVI